MSKKAKKIAYAVKKHRQIQAANCSKKKRYCSPAEAMASAFSSVEHTKITYKLYYYKCSICAGYHLTKVAGGSSIPI